MAPMRKIALGGFALVGGISTVVWVISLLHGKHHQSAWKLLALGLACFLIVSCWEVVVLRRTLGRESRRDDLLAVIDRLDRECQSFEGTMSEYGEWLKKGEVEIAEFSFALATEWAQLHAREMVGPLLVAQPIRLEKIHDIRRSVMYPGSHLGRGSRDVRRKPRGSRQITVGGEPTGGSPREP